MNPSHPIGHFYIDITLYMDQSEPSKKVKRDSINVNAPHTHPSDQNKTKQDSARPEGHQNQQCNCGDSHQIQEICEAILSIENYTKLMAVKIRHQEKSIASIDPHILRMPQFAELNLRVAKCIMRAKLNKQFLDLITDGYWKENLSQVHKQKNAQHYALPSAILQLPLQIAKQWSAQFTDFRAPMLKVIGLVNKHSVGKASILIQGSGMGRIVYELVKSMEEIPEIIETSQNRPIHFICGQYFLYTENCQPTRIFPFVHDFINQWKTEGPYRQAVVPFEALSWKVPPKQLVMTNYNEFEQAYRSNQNNNRWSLIISYLCTERIQNIIEWIQIVYKSLVEGGIWVMANFSCFESNVVELNYSQFRQIIGKSQFSIEQQFAAEEVLNNIPDTMIQESSVVNYLVLRK